MVMLPDYPDRVIAEHGQRVERAAFVGTFVLIAAGACWLLGSMESDSSRLVRFAPVALMFCRATDASPCRIRASAEDAGLSCLLLLLEPDARILGGAEV